MMENKYINYIYIGLIVVLILALVNLIFALKVKSDQSKLFDELQVVKSDQSQFFNELQAGRMHLITDVPYIINHSGNYGLENDLNCPGLDGYCIEIRADNVTLDLKGYSLSHTSRLHDQRTIGIYAKNRKYCTIINGNIEGFFTAIHIEDVRIGEIYSPQYGLHHIENIAASNNTFRAIYVEGLSNTINNNVIINTGGTPYSNDARVYGIESMGSFTQIKNNQILETCATDQGEGVGISTVSGEATLIKNNIIANTKPPLYDNWGIWASGDSGPIIIDNIIIGYRHGFGLASTVHGLIQDNMVYGAEFPFIISTERMIDGGNNRYIEINDSTIHLYNPN